jgi:hypothetical protein
MKVRVTAKRERARCLAGVLDSTGHGRESAGGRGDAVRAHSRPKSGPMSARIRRCASSPEPMPAAAAGSRSSSTTGQSQIRSSPRRSHGASTSSTRRRRSRSTSQSGFRPTACAPPTSLRARSSARGATVSSRLRRAHARPSDVRRGPACSAFAVSTVVRPRQEPRSRGGPGRAPLRGASRGLVRRARWPAPPLLEAELEPPDGTAAAAHHRGSRAA